MNDLHSTKSATLNDGCNPVVDLNRGLSQAGRRRERGRRREERTIVDLMSFKE